MDGSREPTADEQEAWARNEELRRQRLRRDARRPPAELLRATLEISHFQSRLRPRSGRGGRG